MRTLAWYILKPYLIVFYTEFLIYKLQFSLGKYNCCLQAIVEFLKCFKLVLNKLSLLRISTDLVFL